MKMFHNWFLALLIGMISIVGVSANTLNRKEKPVLRPPTKQMLAEVIKTVSSTIIYKVVEFSAQLPTEVLYDTSPNVTKKIYNKVTLTITTNAFSNTQLHRRPRDGIRYDFV